MVADHKRFAVLLAVGRSAAADIASHQRQIAAARQGVDAAERSYVANLERIRNEVSLPIEFIQAIRARTGAHDALNGPISSYNQARYRLFHALGHTVNAQ